MEKSVADHWLALQSEFVDQPRRCIKTIIESADLVTRAQNHIERLLISIEKARKALETSKLLLRNGTASNEPGTAWLALEQHFAPPRRASGSFPWCQSVGRAPYVEDTIQRTR